MQRYDLYGLIWYFNDKLVEEFLVRGISFLKNLPICEYNDLLRSEQAVFRKLEECVAHAASLYEFARRKSLREQEIQRILELFKTHDSVRHQILLA